MIYKYGMAMQRYSPKTAPLFGLVDRRADKQKRFYDVLYYDRELTPTELAAYDLEYIGCVKKEQMELFSY